MRGRKGTRRKKSTTKENPAESAKTKSRATFRKRPCQQRKNGDNEGKCVKNPKEKCQQLIVFLKVKIKSNKKNYDVEREREKRK